MEIINIADFDKGLELLAEKLEMPIPKENIEARKQFVLTFVSYLVNQ